MFTYDIDDGEQYQRRKNLRIDGIPYDKNVSESGGDCLAKVKNETMEVHKSPSGTNPVQSSGFSDADNGSNYDDELQIIINDVKLTESRCSTKCLKFTLAIVIIILLSALVSQTVMIIQLQKQINGNTSNMKEVMGQKVEVQKAVTEAQKALKEIASYTDDIQLLKNETAKVISSVEMFQQKYIQEFEALQQTLKLELKILLSTMKDIEANYTSDLTQVHTEAAQVKAEFKTVEDMASKVSTNMKELNKNYTVDVTELRNQSKEVANELSKAKEIFMFELQVVKAGMADALEGIHDLINKTKQDLQGMKSEVIDELSDAKKIFNDELQVVKVGVADAIQGIQNLTDKTKDDLQVMKSEVFASTKTLNESYIADIGNLRHESAQVNMTIALLQASYETDIGKIQKNISALRSIHVNDIKSVTSEIFRYYKADKVIRFVWPNVGAEQSEHYIWGYVEIFHGSKWGSICNDDFEDNDANVICKTAGYSSGVYNNGKYNQPSFTRKSMKIWLSDLACNGTERSIEQCPGMKWGGVYCVHAKYVGIKCYL